MNRSKGKKWKETLLEHLFVSFWQSGRTEKKLIQSNMYTCEAFWWKHTATENVMFTELLIYIWYSLF